MKFCFRSLLAVTVAVAAWAADAAATVTWKDGGSGGWSDSSNWENGTVPTSGCQVRVNAPSTCLVQESDMTLFKSIGQVVLSGAGATIVVSNTTEHTCQMMISGEGKFVKRGAGRLYMNRPTTMTSQNQFANCNPGGIECYDGILEVASSYNANWVCQCAIGVFAPGSFCFPNNHTSYFCGLYGDGIVTNRQTASNVATYNRYNSLSPRSNPLVFDGIFLGIHDFRSPAENPSNQRFSNPDMVFGVNRHQMVMYRGYVGTVAFPYITGRHNYEYEYLGTGEDTLANNFYMNNDCSDLVYGGGPYGGLNIKASLYNTVASRADRFTLTGDNENACTFSGNIVLSGKTDAPLALRKEGTGTWRMAHATTRNNRGLVEVKRGCLEYATMAARGTTCSLGDAKLCWNVEPGTKISTTNKTSAGAFVYTNQILAATLPYCYVVGNGTNELSSATATFSYCGTNGFTVTDRPIAIDGAGRIASTTKPVFWGNIGPKAAVPTTISLSGTAKECTVAMLTNGLGSVTLVKEGTGSWSLGAEVDVDLVDVRSGTLVFKALDDPRYFRLIAKETYRIESSMASDIYYQMAEFGMWDEDENNLCENLKFYPFMSMTGGMQPGEATDYTATYKPSSVIANEYAPRGRVIDNLFTNTTATIRQSYDVIWSGQNGLGLKPELSNPASWLGFIMRIRDGKRPVRYDMKVTSGFNSYNKTGFRELKSWQLDASADGIVWKTVHNVISNKCTVTPGLMYVWRSPTGVDQEDHVAGAGWEINTSGLFGTRKPITVRVSRGAVLNGEDCKTEIRRLIIDSADGTGTISSMALASDVAIVFENVTRAQLNKGISVNFSNMEGLQNLVGAKTYLDGQLVRNSNLIYRDGKMRLTASGAYIQVK